LGEVHREALAVLTYGVVERKGFILLTGETGTGKSTMVQALLHNLDKNVHYVYFPNPLLSTKDFMTYLAYSAFSKRVHLRSKAEFLIAFECFLKKRSLEDKNFVVIIDEAQELSLDLLEEVRLLSNVGTAQRNLINIFLVGQPELHKKLHHLRCRPLLQRISIRYHMKPLDLQGTQEYIDTALKIAGAADGRKIFPKNALKAIYEYSKGYPRMINILADNLLLLGYSKGIETITPSMVKECYGDLNPDGSVTEALSEKRQFLKRKKAPASRLWRRYWITAASVIFILVLIVLTTPPRLRSLFWRFTGLSPHTSQSVANQLTRDLVPVQRRIIKQIQDTSNGHPTEMEQVTEDEIVNPKGPGRDVGMPTMPLASQDSNTETRQPGEVVIVEKGDTFSELAIALYGYTDEDILSVIHESNPHIKDIDNIEVGQEIIFPPLPLTLNK
jgi:general secretion pathway protein A